MVLPAVGQAVNRRSNAAALADLRNTEAAQKVRGGLCDGHEASQSRKKIREAHVEL